MWCLRRARSVFVPVAARTEVAPRVHRLAAIAADRSTAAGDFGAPAAERPQLSTAAPESSDRRLLRILTLRHHLVGHDDHTVAWPIEAQAELPDAEGRVDRLLKLHLVLAVFGDDLGEVGILLGQLQQKLLQAGRQRLDLDFLDDQGDQRRLVSALQIEDPLTGRRRWPRS